MNKKEAHDLCRSHMYRYVSITLVDGTMYDGIVEHVDDEHVYLAVPTGGIEHEQMRAFFPYPYPYYGYPFYPGFGIPRRRFVRQVLPLAALLSLSLLPFY